MASLDFYAIEQDISDVLEFVLNETDCNIFESYSEHNKELREFKSISEVIEAYNSKSVGIFLLQLWSPSVSSKIVIKKIVLDPQKCNGATHRFSIAGWGSMQLYFGRIQNDEIEYSHFGHNSEKRARNWESTYLDELGSVDEWDWQLLKKLSGKIQYHIRKRLAVSKVSSRPILDCAFKKYSQGYRFKHITIEDKL
jgi:hypothetical protein